MDSTSSCPKLLLPIPLVDIDPEGTFKYILALVHSDEDNRSKFVVRGYARCPYHADILDEVQKELEKFGSKYDVECTGGGRIERDEENKTLVIYGFSVDFGKADHEKTKTMLQDHFPDYTVKIDSQRT